MKYCPICNERYDEEIIRFCTKDGTPLIEEEQPSFTAMPSEAADESTSDLGEETIITRRPVPVEPETFAEPEQPERIVIPTVYPPTSQVRPRAPAAYYPPPPPDNTAKTVILTIVGTVAVLGLGAAMFWALQGDPPSNISINLNANLLNQNANLNTNLGFDSNFNFDTNANFNINYNSGTNLNTNARTPSPSPRPSFSPAPSPAASTAPSARPTASPRPSPRPSVTVSPTPRTGPRPPTPNRTAANDGN